ncbi:irregular chiasm C-roughest protein-like isoform X2 [Plutella xylostella]|uniref:irregular chiasm C-roughest protein-like isoform X2 n=1 Tax=Plutella xylostella TaxID=51655 RepID=UPI00203304C1|nr:irregular chiasm C-roughest protein-like isoform X2 [Plutella xylostella]
MTVSACFITSKKTKLKFRTRHAKMAASENSRRLLGARAGDARRSLAARRNRMWAPEVCLWLAAMLAGCCALQEQKFAMEPQDQTAILGSRVTLPCRVERKAGALQWTKDDFGLGTHRNLSGYDRYSMVGSDEEGDYSLDIRDVTLEDDASYQCQVSSGPNGEPAIRSRYAQLSVLVAPEPPRIIQGAFIDATEGHPVDIECVSVGGKPAAEITWVDGHQAVIRDGVETKVELMPDGQRFTTRSTLRLTPSMEHHNLTVTCQAQNTADRAYRMAFVHVEVKYAPKLTMSLSSPAVNNMIREGSEARIRCAVAANPPAHSYTWYLDDHPLVGDYTDELIIFNVTKKLNNAEVKCEVGNSVGRSEQSMRLQVTYPPSFRSKPMDVEADPDSWVTLQCDVDAAPAPAVRWLLHEPGRVGVKGKSATLKLQVSNKTAGRYICKAAVEGYPEIEAEASVLVKGPPSILSNRTQLAEEGETARVECLYLSVPKPDDVSWYFEGREINFIQNPDYTSVDTILEGGLTRAALVIRSSGAQHYGVYNCSVTNEYGNANAAITLKPLKSLPLFIILIGVSSGIIIFALFTTMVAVCHRRRRQAAPGLSKKPDVTVTGTDLFKDSDRSSNISDLKPQLNGDGGYELEYTSSEQSHKMSGGLPLAGPVPVSPRHDDPLLQFRYSNDYTDPQYTDTYYKHGSLGDYLYDYQGYPPPPTLRVQSPPLAEQQTRSQQGSLTRSIDTASTLPLSGGSQSSSLQRGKADETDAINSLGLPLAGDTPPTPIYAQPQSKHPAHGHGLGAPALALGGGVDVRYSAAYGNPYLRNSSLGYGAQAGGKAGAPAPPPYSAVRSSVVIPQGNGTQLSHV